MGGRASAEAGADLVARLEDTTAVGVGDVAKRVFAIARARAAVGTAIRKRRPRAALLVNYTEFNTMLAGTLRSMGVRVLFYVAPQIWAWRPGRAKKLRAVVDRMAVILPFEEALWREQGVDARYVGHPALEDPSLGRLEARTRLGLSLAPAVAILPGSRPHEVRRLLPTMLDGYDSVRHERASLDARVLLASSLDEKTAVWAEEQAREWRVPSLRVGGAHLLMKAFDATLCASGTVSLEAALAGAVPIITYRVGLGTELLLRPFLLTPYFALPNVLLGRLAFPELLQRDARASNMAAALHAALGKERNAMLAACDELGPILGDKHEASREVATMMLPWL
jgi:lipid-A-disaccharide synthase